STPASSSWVRLPVPGQHNARNALAAIAVGQRLRLDLDAIVQSLAQVALPGRRLELIAEVNGARVYDDYGHHPTEVSVTLGAARELTGGRLLCAFQPHRYSRLQALLPQFATCFDEADELLLLPVYGAGEAPIPGVDSAALADAIRRRGGKLPLTLFDSLDQLPAELRRRLAPGDVAVCMGAGDIYQASARLRQPDDSGEV